MPRLQLSEEEADLIIRVRQRTEADRNWNAALELAEQIVDAKLRQLLPWAQVVNAHSKMPDVAVEVDVVIQALIDQFHKNRKEIKLP